MTDIDWSKAPEGATHWWNGRWYCESWDGWYQWWNLGSKWMFAGVNKRPTQDQIGAMTPRPKSPWTGDGLPPVGEVCEVLNPELSRAEWEKCTVLFVGKYRILYDSESCSERIGYVENLQFRPIRTPEQIAEEERKAAGLELGELYVKGGLIAIYDAGWRPRAKP